MIKLKTGIVIIHYNDFESVKHLVENVENYHVISKIVIVDNNSRKDVKKSLRLITGKKIKLIENKKNFGFAKAINIGCKYLIKELGPCNLIISNSDVIIDKEEDLKALIKELNKKSVGVVAPTIVENKHLNRGWKNPSPFLDSMLNLIYVHRFFRKKYVFYKEEHYDSRTSLVDVVSGCFFIMKSRTLERIGYLDEHTFLYYEENILAKKIHNEKLYIEVCNDILIIHNHSVSIDKNVKKINKLKLQKESQYYFQTTYNHANLWERVLLKTTAFCSRMILAVVYFLKDLIGVKKKGK